MNQEFLGRDKESKSHGLSEQWASHVSTGLRRGSLLSSRGQSWKEMREDGEMTQEGGLLDFENDLEMLP